MVTDPRSGMKTYLDAYITDGNMTDEAGDAVTNLVMYAENPETVLSLYLRRNIEVVFCVDFPKVDSLLDDDQVPYGYEFHTPVSVYCVDKYDGDGSMLVRGTKLMWEAEVEVRGVLESYPTGSQYSLEDVTRRVINVGGEKLYCVDITISYRRSTTA